MAAQTHTITIKQNGKVIDFQPVVHKGDTVIFEVEGSPPPKAFLNFSPFEFDEKNRHSLIEIPQGSLSLKIRDAKSDDPDDPDERPFFYEVIIGHLAETPGDPCIIVNGNGD